MAKGVMRSNKSRDGIAAMLAENIGWLEEDMYDIQQEWIAQHATFEDMQDALDQAGLRVLNRPNLIKQNWYTNRNMPTSEVIAHTITVPIEDATAAAALITDTCTNANITSGYVIHAVKSSDYNVVWGSMVTATFSSGSASISIAARPGAHNAAVTVTVYLCTVAETNVLYGEVSKISGSTYPYMKSIGSSDYPGHDTGDGVVCSVVDLAAGDQITETDGESYTKAIQCAITEKSAYGNTEYLMYYNPNFYRTYTQGQTNIRNYGQIEEMEPGNTYSMSCWVRVLSGDGVWLKMGYGNSYTNDPYNDTINHRSGVSDFIKVNPNGGVWQRISWTFEFNPTGDWYTETSATSNGVTTVTRSYNWFKKICFGICRKFNATVQICGFRLVRGKTYICETYDDLDEDLDATKGRVNALETASAAVPGAIATAKTALLAIMAESESATATAPHVVGDLFTMNDTLYKCTVAIATGETITPGTNCTATTLAAEIDAAAASTPDLSAYAPKASPAFTGSISMGRQAGTTVGLRSVAVGNNAAATGYYSGAIGNYTVAGGIGAVAVGNKSEASGNNSFASGEQTIANHRSQVAFGEYNIQDPNTTYSGRGTYAEIVGNGTSSSARSNARTLDWDGNEWIAGNLTLGSTTLTEAQLQALLAMLT